MRPRNDPSRRVRCDSASTLVSDPRCVVFFGLQKFLTQMVDQGSTDAHTVPYGTDLFYPHSRHFVPGYLHSVPTGCRALRHTTTSSSVSKAPLSGSDRVGLARVLHSFSDGGSEAALHKSPNENGRAGAHPYRARQRSTNHSAANTERAQVSSVTKPLIQWPRSAPRTAFDFRSPPAKAMTGFLNGRTNWMLVTRS